MRGPFLGLQSECKAEGPPFLPPVGSLPPPPLVKDVSTGVCARAVDEQVMGRRATAGLTLLADSSQKAFQDGL